MTKQQYDEAKLRELVMYVANALRDDHAGGATKLNKVMYFADFAHVRRTGNAITGAEYQKLPQGPAPRRLLPVRDALVRSGDAAIVRESFLGYEQHRLIAARPANTAIFDESELTTVDSVLADLRHLTGAQVSELSHAEPGWLLVEVGETIPYAAALLLPQHVDTDVALALAHDVAKRYDLPVA
jgi:hypothetical protein